MKQPSRILDIKSAYGQLILLVFLPICFLAVVDGILVFRETIQTSKTEQRNLARVSLLRYQQLIQNQLNKKDIQLEFSVNVSANNTNSNTDVLDVLDVLDVPFPLVKQKTTANDVSTDISENTQYLKSLMLHLQTDPNIQRVALIDQQVNVAMAVGYKAHEPWGNLQSVTMLKKQNDHIISLPTNIGRAYGIYVSKYQERDLWLFIDMDNQPIKIARYRITMALLVTVLFTLMLLLISINRYSRRWIAPIYEMRMHLQNTTEKNLYQPMHVASQGELNLLQQDLIKTLRRLHGKFQELQDHAVQTEDDLRRAFDEMEMQNISIRNARDVAVSSNQAKSAFLANISHELRTPLNSIDGFINLLARHGQLSDEQDLYVQTIRKSSAHLLAVVNDVLDFSKIEAGKLVLDRHEFDLYDSIYDVADMLSPLASEKGLRMSVLFYNDVPLRIIGDAIRLKQVLTNLVGNAIKFTDVGDIVINVALDDSVDNCLIIRVQDSGMGVSKKNQAYLFQSFSQGDPSITRQYGGTGLGLVISKQLTRLMGGDIGHQDNASENIANHGSTFWFTVPTHIDVLEATNAADIRLPVLSQPLVAPLTLRQNADNNLQMLVWMNHDTSVKALTASLQPLDITVTQTHSLASTLDTLKEHGYHWDWVVVDGDISNSENTDDMMALLKQIRLHYQGRLCVYGYQVGLNTQLLTRYQAYALHEPLDKRQLYNILDKNSKNNNQKHVETRLWQGYRVLAVDDHRPNLLVLDALLAEQGIEVVMANSGFAAIEIISKQQMQAQSNALTRDKQIDLIFMDIQMPRMSGHQAAKEIRKISYGKRIPIIALTAHGMSDEREKLIKSGIDDYVSKPISQPQLLQLLQKWFSRTPPTQSDTNFITNELSHETGNDISGEISNEISNQTSNETSKQANPVHDDNTNTAQTVSLFGTPALAVIDWEDALIRSANKADLAAQLILMMIDSVEDDKQDLQTAWQAQDREQLAQISHRILGASRYTGVPELRQASQNFEDKCTLNLKHSNVSQMAMLKPSYDALIQALDNLAQVDLSSWSQLSYHKLEEDKMTWKMI